MAWWFLILGALVGGSIVAVYLTVKYLDRKKIIELSKKTALEQQLNNIIKAKIEKKDFGIVKVGLYSDTEKKAEMNIEYSSISSEIQEGDVYFL